MDRSNLKPSFNFVNLTHPDELKDEEVQLRIRRLAMSEVGKARRKPKTKRERNEIVLELRNPREGGQGESSKKCHLTFDRLGSGEVDPFVNYPMELDASSRALVANIFRHNTSHSRGLRDCWYTVGLMDAAIFQIVLSNAQLYIHMFRNGPYVSEDDSESLSRHSAALHMVSQKMKDPRQHTSDVMIGSVTGFLCHDFIIGAFERWHAHRQAMLKIVELRGGYETVTRENVRITMSWVDLCGSYGQDIPLKVPMPSAWIKDSTSPPGTPRPEIAISRIWKQQLPMATEWISIFDDLAQLISLDRAFTNEQIEASTRVGNWIEPTLTRLLAIRPLQHGTDRACIIEEVCRLGTLLFLAPVWRMFGVSPVRTAALTHNLLTMLNSHMTEWLDLKPLLVWSVYSGAVEAINAVEKQQFIFMLAVLMNGLQVSKWEELIRIVKSVLWVDTAFQSSDEAIQYEVMAILGGVPRVEELGPTAEEAQISN